MGKGENKQCSVFSWADEVEKEEEQKEEEAREEARAHLLHQKQRPNPFGSARPREVVLQERGIDWKKLDPPSPTRLGSGKEKALKENIPAPRSKASSEANIGLYRRRVPQITSSYYNDHMPAGILVPQLNHPPKIIPTSLSTATRGEYKKDTHVRHRTIHIKPLRHDVFREPNTDQYPPTELDNIRFGDPYDQQKFVVCRDRNYLVPVPTKTSGENKPSYGNRKTMKCGNIITDMRSALGNKRQSAETMQHGQRKRGFTDSGKEKAIFEAGHCIDSKSANSATKHWQKESKTGSGDGHCHQKRR